MVGRTVRHRARPAVRPRWRREPPASRSRSDRRSASPTAGPGPTPRRTRSRPSSWPCASVPPGSRATCGSPPMAWPSSTTMAWSGAAAPPAHRRARPGRSARPHPHAWPSSTTTLGTDFDLSLDVKDPAAGGPPWSADSLAADPTMVARLWLCDHDHERLVALAGGLARTSAWSTPPACSRIKEGPERRAARLQEQGIDAMNLHHSDWSGGLGHLVPPVPGPALRAGTRSSTGSSTACCAWGSTACSPTTSTAWWRRWLATPAALRTRARRAPTVSRRPRWGGCGAGRSGRRGPCGPARRRAGGWSRCRSRGGSTARNTPIGRRLVGAGRQAGRA